MQTVILAPKSLVISAAKINQALQNLLCNVMRLRDLVLVHNYVHILKCLQVVIIPMATECVSMICQIRTICGRSLF
jgi:hypothetical protein